MTSTTIIQFVALVIEMAEYVNVIISSELY